ncbi:transmembrane glycoprotein [Diplocarpon rosae]|nr:transmembrane glycoprotein [Diplocarpon rosae]
MILRAVFSAAAITGSFTYANPSIAFPLNSQVPPAARVATPFSYAFPSSTFFSTLPITYALSSGPSWLSLDSNTRTLSGTPSTSDTGSDTVTSVPISITASDADGSITVNASLVISKDPAPSISIPVTQLQSAGRFSAPSTLLYYPSTPFSFNLEPGTFTKNGRSDSFSYYAVTTDNTPMPAWIQFDGSTLEFSGQTPDYSSLILPPQTFGLQLIASDVEGFGGSSMFFEIEVGVHLLAFKNADVVINATTGDSIEFDVLSGNLELDGNTPKSSDLVSTSAQIPSWMTFNNATLWLTGTVPADAPSANVTIQTTDIYGDTADVIVRVIISTELFSESVRDLNATIGSTFSYDLGTYLTNRSDTSLAVQISPPQTWLSFNSETFNLIGQVPSGLEPTAIDIVLSATSNSHKTAESESFKLLLVASNHTTTSPSVSSSSTPKKTPTVAETGAPTVLAASSHKRLSTNTILAISIPLGLAFLTLLLAFCFYCYRRRAAKKQRGFGKIEKRSISSPIEAASSRPSLSEDVYQPSPLLPVPSPRPLQLDMSGFTTQGGSRPAAVLGPNASADSAERGRNPMRMVDNPLRRSKTMSDPRLSQILGSYDSDIGRRRSKSANELSRSDNSWRYTQDSNTYPNLRSSGTSSSQTQNLTRSYSNYSRKGHVRRSAMIFPLNTSRPNRDSYPRQRPKSTILNLRDSNFSETPLDSFSALQSQANIQEETEAAGYAEIPALLKSTRRQSKLTRMVDRPISIGHGRSQTTEVISGIAKRRSIGHGKDQAGVLESKRDSRTWLTVATLLENEKRRSIASASSATFNESLRKARPMTPRKTIRQVTKSPSIHHTTALSESSGNSRLSRPVSRRVGSSPFFGGSSIRNSNSKGTTKNSRQFRASYADSPTVPEEAIMISLEATIARGLREMSDETEPRDSFGISYGMAKEGTRQLRSFVSSQLRRSRTRDSLVSTGSRDSRFESAASQSPMDRSPNREQRPRDEFEYEDYLPDGFSDGSWETQRSARDESDGQMQRSDTAGPGYGTSKSTPSSPELGRGARIVPGAGRRPVSSDAEGLRRVGTQRGEMDYTAYI